MAKTDEEIIADVRKAESDSALSSSFQKALDDKATQAELDALTAHIAGCTPAAED
jgi:hypothetical protein